MEPGYKYLRNSRRTKRTQKRTQGKSRQARKLVTKTELREALIRESQLKLGATLTNGKLAVEIMDEQILRYEELAKTLYPWGKNGKPIKGMSVQAYYWTCEMMRDYLALRAPYQTARLSAVQIVPAGQNKRETTVNVTILNERGETEYTDAPEAGDDSKLIEHVPMEPGKEEAA